MGLGSALATVIASLLTSIGRFSVCVHAPACTSGSRAVRFEQPFWRLTAARFRRVDPCEMHIVEKAEQAAASSSAPFSNPCLSLKRRHSSAAHGPSEPQRTDSRRRTRGKSSPVASPSGQRG
ncbi:hypothetical protein HDK90DRAFT_73978 [Phyllosticta capitalensis]|uniref:Secreted protein n=1 Tax=Phyllosticta capitalensis TaxID=121624 RepID=A0ABR1YDG4_9PEZI